MMTTAPDRTEAPEYFFTYIDQVDKGDIRDVLAAQLEETLPVLCNITEEQSVYRYAPDKWSIREVVGHLNDTERLFTFRALWFARGFESPLPSFDQQVAVASSRANETTLDRQLEEFTALRTATIAFFRHLPADAWARRGTASGNPFTVRALAYVTAGHVAHHMRILQERYVPMLTRPA